MNLQNKVGIYWYKEYCNCTGLLSIMTFINENMHSNLGILNFRTSQTIIWEVLCYCITGSSLRNTVAQKLTIVFNLGINFFFLVVYSFAFVLQLTFRLFLDFFFFWHCLHCVARRSEKLTARLANE